ncbi:MAG: hypothetical protein IT287_05990, partial [Bdellovibrionaceae bacterium]|nr:hypothetical protein [Pseudobdellovibrionaceae bacterium]
YNSLDSSSLFFGIFFLVLSSLVFWWAYASAKSFKMRFAFYGDDQSDGLIRNGSYAFIRHPFYLSYMIAWFGAPLLHGIYYTYAFAVIMTSLYYIAASSEERAYADTSLARQYAEYKNKTGMFLPNFFKFFSN